MGFWLSRFAFAAIAVGLIAFFVMAGDYYLLGLPAKIEPYYVGRNKCAECHQPQYQQWVGSHHDKALELATEQSVRADFDDATLDYHGVSARMFRRDGKFFIHTEGPDGEMDDFEVKYVIGYEPLQQYMVEFPDGRVQVLRESWDTERRRWFYHGPPDVDEKLDADDPLHWTSRMSNWNHMCAECHSTDLQKNYDFQTDSFHTTFKEIDVSCETCHGPGSVHVELAESKSPFWDRQHGYGLPNLKSDDHHNELQSCAKCHSRRRNVHPGHHGADEYFDHYGLTLIEENIYHADGQVLDEDYVYGSFLQSKMYQHKIRCTDCHNPHSLELKFEGNKLCTDCHQHPAGKYDTPAHHHHTPGSEGASCVECHMPARHYMVVDPRRDHSLRVPRPDISVDIGTPNACSRCHVQGEKAFGEPRYEDVLTEAALGDEQAQATITKVDQEMAEAFFKWYGKPQERRPHHAYALDKAWKGADDAEAALLDVFNNRTLTAFARASALNQLNRHPSPQSLSAAAEGIESDDPLLRSTAVSTFADLQPPADELIRLLQPLLDDPVRLVRTEAARALSAVYEQLDGDAQARLKIVLEEYLAGQQADADQPGAHLNIGVIRSNLGDAAAAIESYQNALRLDPRFIPAKFNLAVLYNQQGNNSEAEKLLREVVGERPTAVDAATVGQAHYSLGLLLAEDADRLEEATGHLKQATEALPEYARAFYNYGLALQSLQKTAQAERALLQAYKLNRADPQTMQALMMFYLSRGVLDRAEIFANELARFNPHDPQLQSLLQQLRRQREAQE